MKEYFSFMIPLALHLNSALKHQLTKGRIRGVLAEGKKICIELGAGDKKGENGWLTIDMTPGCDLFWDLRKGIPFPNESVSKIYSSHFFEHLSFREGQQFLDECRRVLVPGGVFSVCVPNARLYLEAYVKSIPLEGGPYFGYKPAYNNTTRIDYVNYTAFMDGHHKYMFDEENLLHILNAKGFKNVRARSFDPELDIHSRDFESIYAEAEK